MASHYISALLVAALNMAGRQVSVDDNALRAIASEVTNAQFCSAENTEILTNIRHSSLWVSADPDRCAHWKSGIDNAEAISGQITLADHRVPIVIYANRAGLSRPNSIEHIILRITGGPGIPISPLGYESAYFSRSSASSVMVTVGYSGTSHNSQYPEENFTIATRQIVELGQLLRARQPNAKILILGESFGAILAVNAYNDLRTDNYLNILLVSPLTDSVNDQLLHLNGAEYGIVATDSPRNVRVRSETGRHFSSIPVLGRDLLRSFMPHAQNGISLAARLENFDERKISFIFGSEDRRLNRISVENFMAKAKNVTYIQGMGHISSVGHTDEVADTVEAVFSGM